MLTKRIPTQTWPGLICIALLALVSGYMTALSWIEKTGISALVIAILLGMLLGNGYRYPDRLKPGIHFCAKTILRLAILLYGFRISFQQIANVGVAGCLIDVLVVVLTLFIGYFIGRNIFKLDRDLALLISSGAAICGAAAVLAVEEILKSEPHKAAVAIGSVVLFGTTAMFLYPMLQHAGYLGLNNYQFGVYAGASIHEVAQVLVTGSNVSDEAGQVAVIVKMIRVLLLVPVLFLLAAIRKKAATSSSTNPTKLTIPWFAIGFVLVVAFNSLALLSAQQVTMINQLDTLLLTMAMAAIGMETKWDKIKQVGMKPLYLAAILFVWLMISVWLMLRFFS